MERSFLDSNDKGHVTTRSMQMEGKGDITVGTTQVEISFTGVTDSIRIRADTGNSGTIYIGLTGVLANDTNEFAKLAAGDEAIIDYCDYLNGVYAIASATAQTVNAGALIQLP